MSLPIVLPTQNVAPIVDVETMSSTSPLSSDEAKHFSPLEGSAQTVAKPKRSRKKKTPVEETPAPVVHEQCAQCGKEFDYRDRIYNGAMTGLCNACRQRHNKFLLKGQYQRLQVKNDEGEDTTIVNAFRGRNRQTRRQVTQLNQRMDAASARHDMQEWQRLYRIARSKGLVD